MIETGEFRNMNCVITTTKTKLSHQQLLNYIEQRQEAFSASFYEIATYFGFGALSKLAQYKNLPSLGKAISAADAVAFFESQMRGMTHGEFDKLAKLYNESKSTQGLWVIENHAVVFSGGFGGSMTFWQFYTPGGILFYSVSNNSIGH